MKTLKHTFLGATAYGKRLPTKKLRNGLFVVAAFAGLAGLIALTDPPKSGAAASAGAPVTVLNTPLPISPTGTQTVAGTVSITGTPGVNVMNTPSVMVSGTPNVNVSNMPTVGIDPLNSTVKLLRDPENPARQPVNHLDGCSLNPGDFTCSAFSPYIVPAGKELVIESASASVRLPTTQKVADIHLATTAGGTGTIKYLAPSYQADDGTFAHFLASQQMRFYADPSTTVIMECDRNTGAGTGGCAVGFSGYLVDVP